MNIGSKLMHKVISSSEENGIWTLYSSTLKENEVSIRLHLKFGFRIMGGQEKIAKLYDRWRDTILFEKRSTRTGLD